MPIDRKVLRNADWMRIYSDRNVFETSLDRIRWIFDEFENVVVNVSGGKDSTVCFRLALQVAREKNRLPLNVMWFDQEAEWQATVDEVKKMMYHPDVKPWWFQMPIRLFNATSAKEHWLMCWDPARKEDWVHPQDPISIKENLLGTDRFHELFKAFTAHYFKGQKVCLIAGIRCEESRTRFMGLTGSLTYKWATWGTREAAKEDHYSLYPIYDWSYSDVWKAILDNGWHYNRIYDAQYRWGIPVPDMRVSNVHHETAVMHLFYMQEVEPHTYERLVNRISGIHMASKMGWSDYFPTDLPMAFKDWREYRDYLLEHLIDNPDWKVRFDKMFAMHDREFGEEIGAAKYQAEIASILTYDWEGARADHFLSSPTYRGLRRRRRRERQAAAADA